MSGSTQIGIKGPGRSDKFSIGSSRYEKSTAHSGTHFKYHNGRPFNSTASNLVHVGGFASVVSKDSNAAICEVRCNLEQERRGDQASNPPTVEVTAASTDHALRSHEYSDEITSTIDSKYTIL